TNSGVIAQSGLTYVNAFLFYKRDQSLGPNGEVVATGSNAVMMDLNTFAWVATQRLRALGDAKVSVAATLPIATNSLSSDATGAISGGGGLADSYFQLLILGWQLQRADVKAAYGFLAPTGRFEAGANDHVNAIGLGFNVLLPARKVSVGTRYFDEFGGRSTYQGYSFQITGSITF